MIAPEAVDVINGSNLSEEEKTHLRRLVCGMKLSPELFEGVPNFGQILHYFPVPPRPTAQQSGRCLVQF
jgi:hypothetical protein